MSEADQPLLELGKISGVFGVHGWVKIFSWTDPREGIVEYSPWMVHHRGQWREMQLEAAQRQGKMVIAKLAGVDDRDQAMLLNGAVIAVHPGQLKKLKQDQYYWRDLEGLQVLTTAGVDLGRVDHLMETGANDVLVVRGDRERLIPFTPGHAVQKVDKAAGVITVDWDPDF
jgi:16S rRNA processing protein RimM